MGSWDGWRIHEDDYTYGQFGNVLTHSIGGFPASETYTYWDEGKYFQKQSFTDMNGNLTTYDYGTESDIPGNRGSLLSVRDALHQPDGAAFTYQYNGYGQKVSETNLDNVVTAFTYGDAWGNLTQAVQDPTPNPTDGLSHLNRTTVLQYDLAGHVTYRWDPNNSVYAPNTAYAASVAYNSLGQPAQAYFPPGGSVPAETVAYTYQGLNGAAEAPGNPGNGRVLSVADSHGTTTMGYESGCDRVSSVTDSITGPVSYTYAPHGEVKSKTLPDSDGWQYFYDEEQNVPAGQDVGNWIKDQPDNYRDRVSAIKDEQGNTLCEYTYTGGELSSNYVNPGDMGRPGDEIYNEEYADGSLVSYCKTSYHYDYTYNYSDWSR